MTGLPGNPVEAGTDLGGRIVGLRPWHRPGRFRWVEGFFEFGSAAVKAGEFIGVLERLAEAGGSAFGFGHLGDRQGAQLGVPDPPGLPGG